MSITLDYEVWNDNVDILIGRVPNSSLALTYINGPLTPGYLGNKKLERKDSEIGPAVDSVIALLASTVEWLRWYGLSADEVQQRARAYVRNARDVAETRLLNSVRLEQDEIADGAGIKGRLDAATLRAIAR